MKPSSLAQITAKFVASHLLYEVDSNERIIPKFKPGELILPTSVCQQLLYQLRVSRTLTYELLEIFNSCHLNELSLLMDFSNASPFSGSSSQVTIKTSGMTSSNPMTRNGTFLLTTK
jgi:hypothetical protein